MCVIVCVCLSYMCMFTHMYFDRGAHVCVGMAPGRRAGGISMCLT